MLNIPQFTVSEFSASIKRVVEDAFGYVKIKGEISGFKRATSGHLYFTLKDNNAALSAVFFRNMAQLTNFEIADGLEVCASGRITTFEGRSNYQIIVEKLEIAGIGAILEMIEKRRQKLLAEGLFDEIHKKPLPFFPKRIGVITSPTGAVIEDIKHRISARCPSHIMLFESAVQGEKAAFEVTAGIKFFNKLPPEKRPEVIIIARGGGSIEDLMPFNDEALVRAVFASEIPIVSAVGHETDTTLIDYVSDLRAPTPTAAAEIVTPILSELESQVDLFCEKLEILPQQILTKHYKNLENLQKYIVKPEQRIAEVTNLFLSLEKKLFFSLQGNLNSKYQAIAAVKISKDSLSQKLAVSSEKSKFIFDIMNLNMNNLIKNDEAKLISVSKLLKANHYHEILKRGFALIKNEQGDLIMTISDLDKAQEITVEMSDGKTDLLVNKQKFLI